MQDDERNDAGSDNNEQDIPTGRSIQKGQDQQENATHANQARRSGRRVSLQKRMSISWRQTSNWNKLLVLLTAIIAVSNGCYTHYARKQFKTMSDQLRQMEASGRQTDQLIALYRQQLEQLRKQTEDTHNLALATKDQAEAAKKSAAAATTLASPSIFISRIIQRFDQARNATEFEVYMFNPTSITAESFVADCKWFMGDRPINEIAGFASEIIPDARAGDFGGHIENRICGMGVDSHWIALIHSGNTKLTIYVTASYRGLANKKYTYCDKQQYDVRRSDFEELGECDISKPFPQ